MTDFVTQDNQVVLGDNRYDIVGPVRFQTAVQVAGKVTFGSTTSSDQTIADEWIQKDWREGHLIKQLDEATQEGRFWYSTVDTRFRGKLLLPALATDIGAPTGIVVAAEAIWSFASKIYASFGGHIYRWDGSSWSTELLDTGASVTDVIIYNGNMLVAYTTGYSYSDTGDAGDWTNSGDDTLFFTTFYASSVAAIFKIDAAGNLESSADGITWGSNPGVAMTDVTPTGLVVYRNIDDQPIVYVSTATGLYSADVYNQIYYKTSLDLLYNPNAGKSPKVWTDSLLYVPDTLALWRFPRGGAITNVGLDREDGLPTFIRGHIIKLVPHPNWLLALVDVSAIPGTAQAETILNSWSMAYTATFTSNEYSGFPSIQAFNGSGWHTLYVGDIQSVSIKTMCLDTSLSNYQRRLYFSEPDGIKYIVMPEGNYDPVRDGSHEFALSGLHITSWFDSNMSEIPKLASSIKFRCEFVTADETIDVYVRINDNDNDERFVGTIDDTTIADDGTVSFPLSDSLFDSSITDDEQGLKFYTIQFRFVFSRGSDAGLSPTILFFDLRHKKMFPILWAWTFSISADSFNQGLDLRKSLKTLARQVKLHHFAYKGYEEVQRRVLISNISGVEHAGLDGGGRVTVTVVELEDGDA